ncbi:prolyl-tRNA synthetase [Mycolicibacterium mageritense DSM 44476 = CIP 104973]|uniref:Aminoacyl-tRNA deacylase n=1 Tax=Mycolicibacterium mageritense TaxID=53462 RepID=A0ABM7HMU0_MYCME|nr:YbaK/EbsC family protein [Mycolicibacterium mageritense]MCC9183497.1 YbaK/EbsC family protein [Mycolicibacterium mageritense]BBX31829.1 aminoacyl-tRNA deacylase [Mycolicibacterium mageritense]CDO23623.1 prolyl-tRNA synthetase [Mycolicibacterium mageritense DSM 44476 = CIP 104973]
MNERNSLVAAAVAAAGIEPAIKILDADAKTAAAAAAQLGCEVGAIANSLVFECDGEPLLVMASGAARVDTDVVAQRLGATAINKANPKLVRNATGQVIGGVAPTGHPAPLRTVVDETLATYPVIWTAAGTADSVMPLTYAQLLALTGGMALAVR